MLPYNENLKQLSKQLRDNMTDAERHLWAKIRMRQLKGYQFYRQKPIGDYIVDFFCPKANLVIEVDGGQHKSHEMMEYDRIRNEYLANLGLRVLRFTNIEVMRNATGVIESIEENVGAKIPLNPPFSKGEKRVTTRRRQNRKTSPFLKKTSLRKPSPFSKGRVRGI